MATPKQEIEQLANRIRSQRFILFAAIASVLWDTAFKVDEFLQHNKQLEVNIIKGNSVALAATTSFANTTITIPGADDRRRLVCAVGLVFDGGIVSAKVRGEVAIQVHKNLTLNWQRRNGKSVDESIARYSLGFNQGLMSDGGAIAAADETPDTVVLPMLAGEHEALMRKLAPNGIESAMQGAIDLIEEGKSLTAKIEGLNGVTVAVSHSGVNVTPYALVVDAL